MQLEFMKLKEARENPLEEIQSKLPSVRNRQLVHLQRMLHVQSDNNIYM